MIRVVIADDDRLTREGFRLLLQRTRDIQVVGEARDGQEALQVTRQVRPDVVLMDMKMPRWDGLKATEEILAHVCCPRILFVANSWDPPLVRQAVGKGAQGFVAKPDVYGELAQAIRDVAADQTYFSQQVTP